MDRLSASHQNHDVNDEDYIKLENTWREKLT